MHCVITYTYRDSALPTSSQRVSTTSTYSKDALRNEMTHHFLQTNAESYGYPRVVDQASSSRV
jgi:hypothetical protein